MNWSDEALLLGVSQGGGKVLALNLLTARHGRCQGAVDISGREDLRLLPGCAISMDYSTGGMDEAGRVELRDVRSGVEAGDHCATGLLVVRTVSELLSATIELSETVAEVYGTASGLFEALSGNSERWPVHYVRLEMAALRALGLARGIDRCRAAHRHGETVWFSPRTGACHTRSEAGAFLDRLMPVPGFLMGGGPATLHDVEQGLEITRLLFGLDAEPEAAPRLPGARREVIAAIRRLGRIPPEARLPGYRLPDHARRKLLLSMRALIVPCPSKVRSAR